VNDAAIDPLYSLGVPEMDQEHARCIDLVEAFRVAAAGHLADSVGLAAAQRVLEELLECTHTHFANEERLLASYHYPALAEHKARHRDLTAAMLKLLRELAEHRDATTPLKLNLFVTVWLLEHIMTDDWKYASFVIAQREKI